MTALERKQRTESLLESLSVPFIEHLPLIEEENEVQIRTPQEIAKRILILTYLCYVAEDQEAKNKVIEFVITEKLWDDVSAKERELFQKEPSDQDKIDISWRSEAIWLLLWVIRKVNTLEFPESEIHIAAILEALPALMASTKGFVDSSTIRSTSDILDISDLTYRLHWAARNADLNNLKSPLLNSSIISERHYAINWVTFYADDWDEITTDT